MIRNVAQNDPIVDRIATVVSSALTTQINSIVFTEQLKS